MSEQINVDHAFDPQARQAQAEFDAYLESRPYQDAKGAAHNPDNGQFINTDQYFNDARAEHKYGTRDAGDYEKMSMTKLAKELGQAELDEDPTRIGDIEDVLYTKMDDFVANAQKTSGEQTDEDRTTAGNNLLDRIMKAKEAYKTSVTGTETDKADKSVEKPAEEAKNAETETPAEVKKAAATTLEYDTDLEPGTLTTLADKMDSLKERIAKAKADGDKAKAASLQVEHDAIQEDMDNLIDKGIVKGRRKKNPATATTPPVVPTTELLNEEDGLRMRRQDLIAQRDKAFSERDPAFHDIQKEIDAIDARAKVRGYTTVTPTMEQPAVVEADVEVVEEDDSAPAKVGRIRGAWRKLKERVSHATNGNYSAVYGKNKAPLGPLHGPTAPVDLTAPFNPINPDNIHIVDSTKEKASGKKVAIFLGAAVVAAAGAFAAYKGFEAAQHLQTERAANTIANAAKQVAEHKQPMPPVTKAWLESDAAKHYFDGLRAVDAFPGNPHFGQPGFEEATRVATELAQKVNEAKINTLT